MPFPFSVQNLCPTPCPIALHQLLPHNAISVRHRHLRHAQVFLLTKSSNLKQAAKRHLRDQTKEKQRQATVLVEHGNKHIKMLLQQLQEHLHLPLAPCFSRANSPYPSSASPAPGHHYSNNQWTPQSQPCYLLASHFVPCSSVKAPSQPWGPISGSSATLCPGRETPAPSLAPAASFCSSPQLRCGLPGIWGPTQPMQSSAETTTPLSPSKSALGLLWGVPAITPLPSCHEIQLGTMRVAAKLNDLRIWPYQEIDLPCWFIVRLTGMWLWCVLNFKTLCGCV